jgi:hypothetical protein
MLADVRNFINTHTVLCAATLGLAIVGYLGYRAVVWLRDCCRFTAKVNDVAQDKFQQSVKNPSPKASLPASGGQPVSINPLASLPVAAVAVPVIVNQPVSSSAAPQLPLQPVSVPSAPVATPVQLPASVPAHSAHPALSLPVLGQPAIERPFDIVDSWTPPKDYQAWKTEVMEKVKKEISEIGKSYRRADLAKIPPDKANGFAGLDEVATPEGITYRVAGARYYPFNAEKVRDYGWGCAWRSIQTCLSGCPAAPDSTDCLSGKTPSFLQLFQNFGPEENLRTIYHDLFKKTLKPGMYAPYKAPSGWAEPFIGQLALHFYGISSDLELVHGRPKNAASPQEVFHNAPMSFEAFRQRLEKHFASELPPPVMIDNGYQASTIIGYGYNKDANETTLWCADPHIDEGVNQEENKLYGLFTVTLDASGRIIRHTLSEADHEKMYQGKQYNPPSFAEDGHKWMALFPYSHQMKWAKEQDLLKNLVRSRSPSPIKVV